MMVLFAVHRVPPAAALLLQDEDRAQVVDRLLETRDACIR